MTKRAPLKATPTDRMNLAIDMEPSDYFRRHMLTRCALMDVAIVGFDAVKVRPSLGLRSRRRSIEQMKQTSRATAAAKDAAYVERRAKDERQTSAMV